MTAEVYHTLKKIVEEKYGKASTNVGDEGGFAPQLTTPEQALDLLVAAIKKAGYSGKMKIAIDAAASEFYDEATGCYIMDKSYTKDEMVEYYYRLIKTYPIATLEDPFDQDDFDSWAKLTEKKVIKIRKMYKTGKFTQLFLANTRLSPGNGGHRQCSWYPKVSYLPAAP